MKISFSPLGWGWHTVPEGLALLKKPQSQAPSHANEMLQNKSVSSDNFKCRKNFSAAVSDRVNAQFSAGI